MKEFKEAMFYERLEEEKVECTLCPHYCKVAPGKTGICGVRQNIDGQLVSLIYAKASSIAVDPIEKKPLCHFHPGSKVLSLGSYGCNMKCGFCQNWRIAHKNFARDQGLVYEEVSPERVVQMAKETGSQGIAWTYNEPTIWFEYTFDSAILAKKAGLYTVYVTNGYITEPALDKIGPYLDAYSVDLKSFSNEFYQKVCKIKDFMPVLTAI
ncbi:hypothetical protein A3F86_00550 [candidate division WOR-1 bacterium RIFCSPLOWO2_12_FULL_45_9]|nr:MAG: hypothetical protein A3F86_00550 [candidate division WOR-1 bacterium RIFCSPLOWO2_12_FULL_45_9]